MSEELLEPHAVHPLGDSSANHGIAHRPGTGKVKHLSIRQLWLQERVMMGDPTFTTIPRLKNLSDVMTHHWTAPESKIHFPGMHSERRRMQQLWQLLILRGGLGGTQMHVRVYPLVIQCDTGVDQMLEVCTVVGIAALCRVLLHHCIIEWTA